MAGKSDFSRERSSAATDTAARPLVTDTERNRMITEAAYRRSLQRGAQPGNPMEDWLMVEREIEHQMPEPAQQKRELEAREKLRAKVRELLGGARETLNAETIRKALVDAKAHLKTMGEHTADTVDRVAASVEKELVEIAHRAGRGLGGASERAIQAVDRTAEHLERDLTAAAARVNEEWRTLTSKTGDLLHGWRDRGGQFLVNATHALGEWAKQHGAGGQPPRYRAGEVAAAGTYECAACQHQLQLATSAHLPPCAKCRHLEYRKK